VINIASPIIESDEIDAVNRVLESGQLAQGPMVERLEHDFAKLCGTKYAVALNSGTAALHSSLHVLGIGPGDEVITTPYSFIASINSILMVGAAPVLVDIEPSTFNLDPTKLEAAITKKTKAIIPIHLYGQPASMEEIGTTANANGIHVIEDACQAVGAQYNDKKTGSMGVLGCFSLYATKNITSGEGGVITTDNADFVTSLKEFRQHGMTAQYEYAGLGYNYRLSDLHAAIAVEQVKKIDLFTAARQQIAAALTEGLKDLPGIIVPPTAPNRDHVYQQYTIRVTKDFPISRGELKDRLKAKGIGSGIYYPKGLHEAAHIQKLGYKKGDFPVTELAAEEVLSLPVHPKVTDADVKQIINTMREFAGVKH
jgi:dTDP-4-amino-4,6-dideoxygalactose transaminase